MEHPALQVTDPGICIVRLARGERPGQALRALLRPVDPGSFHVYRLPAGTLVELHDHDYDEHWLFIDGRPRVTLRTAAGITREFDLEPGDLVACVRGVEHTLAADHELVYYQYTSVLAGDERPGHLQR